MKETLDQHEAAKETYLRIMELAKRVEEGSDRYFIAKVIDIFITLPARYQAAFIDYFCTEIPNDRWTKAQGDDTLYLSALRAITLHFTGLAKANQPTLLDFNKHLTAFLKSDHFAKLKVVVRRPKKTFSDGLKHL